MTKNDKDVYILYYDEYWHNADQIYEIMRDVRAAVHPKPVVAIPNRMKLQGMSRSDFMNIMDQLLGGRPDFKLKNSSTDENEFSDVNPI